MRIRHGCSCFSAGQKKRPSPAARLSASPHPLPEDETVIVDGAGVLFFQVGHELGRKRRVVVDGVCLTVDVSIAVEEFLEPVGGAFRVAGAVEMAVGAGQAAFEHLENAFVPGGDLVTVGVLESRALDAGNVLFIVGTEDIDLAAEELHDVAGGRGADDAHQLRPPETAHRLQHVAFQCAEGIAQHDQQALAPGGADPLRDGNGAVKIGLSGAGGSGLDVPAVGTVAQVLLLKLSQWHCLHLPAAPSPSPEHLRRGLSRKCLCTSRGVCPAGRARGACRPVSLPAQAHPRPAS